MPIVGGKISAQQLFTGLYNPTISTGLKKSKVASYSKLVDAFLVKFWRKLLEFKHNMTNAEMLRLVDMAMVTTCLRCEHGATEQFDHDNCQICVQR